MLKPEYVEWIDNYRERHKSMLGRCISAVQEMQEAFPELRIAKGHVYCPHPWGKRGHAWCATEDGTIVDPTGSQFPVIVEYEEWKPGDMVYVSKCMDCGMEMWAAVDTLDEEPTRKAFCSTECEIAHAAYMNGGYRDDLL